jgi:thiol-disulfide isomerase/thioredoxin
VNPGTVVLVVAVVAALAFGLWRAYADGRFRGTHPVRGAEDAEAEPVESVWDIVVASGPVAAEPGARATLLQFSSAFCAPCRATRRVLAEVATVVPGVTHVEIDAEHHLALVRRLGILRTPTTLVLDAAGHEVTRATGAPDRQQVLHALATFTTRPGDPG